MDASGTENWFVIFKFVAIAATGICALLGTVTETHKKNRGQGKKLTAWGKIYVVITVIAILLAVGIQILENKRQGRVAKTNQDDRNRLFRELGDQKQAYGDISKQLTDQKQLNAQMEVEFKDKLQRILSASNLSNNDDARKLVEEKLRLIAPELIRSEGGTNLLKKREEFAKVRVDRITKESENKTRKSSQVFQDILFCARIFEERVKVLKTQVGDEMQMDPINVPDNFYGAGFHPIVRFSSGAKWELFVVADQNDRRNQGFPWLEMRFYDSEGKRAAWLNLMVNPTADSFEIFHEELGVEAAKVGKVSDFETTARDLILHAIDVAFLQTSPLDAKH